MAGKSKGNKKNSYNSSNGSNKKLIHICVLCALAGGILIGGIGMMIYKDLSNGSTNGTTQTAQSGEEGDQGTQVDSDAAENLEDGAVFDFEKAGYIKLGEYKGLEADVEPEDEEVYAVMITVAEETKVEGDDKVANGDLVNIDFTAKLDGAELEEASGEDEYVLVGKGEYIDDFEKGLVGIETGKKKTIDCKFPSDYDDEDLAGKTAQFTITVNGKFSDKTAKKASDGKYKTIQEYFDYEKNVQREENKTSKSKGEFVWDSFKDDCEIESAPESMLTRAEEDIEKMYTNFAKLSGVSLEELLANFGMTEDSIPELARDTVIDYMISKTVAAKEGITLEDDFYFNALRTNMGYEEGDDETTLSNMEAEYKEGQGSRPKDDMLVERVKQYIGENAKES